MRSWLTKEAAAGFLLGFLPTLVLVFATSANAAVWTKNANLTSGTLGMVNYSTAMTFSSVNIGTGGVTYQGSKNQALLGSMLFNLTNTTSVPLAATGNVSNNIAGLNVLGNLVLNECSVPWSNPTGLSVCSGTQTDVINLGSNVPSNVPTNYGTFAAGQTKYYRVGSLLSIGTMNITATANATPGRSGIDRTLA